MALNSFSHIMNNNKRVDLVDICLFEDANGAYVRVTYEVETDQSVRRITLPKVKLPIHYHQVKVRCDHIYPRGEAAFVDIGFGETPAYLEEVRGYDGRYYYVDELVHSKTHKMTVAEIEKKLGYKIEIVSEEG